MDDWQGWRSLEAEARFLLSLSDLGDLLRVLEQAKETARSLGWEGDVREGPYFSQVPYPPESLRVLAWKQDNDGETVIVSPVPLPYLKSF